MRVPVHINSANFIFFLYILQELSDCNWTKKDKLTIAPNIVAFTKRFNHVRMRYSVTGYCTVHVLVHYCSTTMCLKILFIVQTSFWVVREILNEDHPRARAEVVTQFIKISKVCHSCFVYHL